MQQVWKHFARIALAIVCAVATWGTEILGKNLPTLDAIHSKAETLDAFLDDPALVEEYYVAAAEYYGGTDAFSKASYIAILNQMRQLRRESLRVLGGQRSGYLRISGGSGTRTEGSGLDRPSMSKPSFGARFFRARPAALARRASGAKGPTESDPIPPAPKHSGSASSRRTTSPSAGNYSDQQNTQNDNLCSTTRAQAPGYGFAQKMN